MKMAPSERVEVHPGQTEPSAHGAPEELTARWPGHSSNSAFVQSGHGAAAIDCRIEVDFRQYSVQKYCGNAFICCKLLAHFITPASLTDCYLIESTDPDIFLLFAEAPRRRLPPLRPQLAEQPFRSLHSAELAPSLLRLFKAVDSPPPAFRQVRQAVLRGEQNLWVPAFVSSQMLRFSQELLARTNALFELSAESCVTAVGCPQSGHSLSTP